MGISSNFAPLVVRTLARLEQREKLMTLGRQSLDFGPEVLEMIAAQCGVPLRAGRSASSPMTQEEFFYRPGVDKALSLDISDFEGASHVLDLNDPPNRLPARLRAAYDVVIDGGTHSPAVSPSA